MVRSVRAAASWPSPAERGEAGRDQRGLVDRRLVAVLEVAQEPAGGDSRMPARLLARDQQSQLERVRETDPWKLFRGCLRGR